MTCIHMSTPTTPPDVSDRKRAHIRASMLKLRDAMPDDALRAECDRHLEMLYYSAPELLDQRWCQMHAFMNASVPDTEQLRGIWNEALEAYPKERSASK